ncbi:MAG TPA: hypothetical protein PLF01_07700 [Alphaproteobacteria bacterium]|nr:hypothetical protein [Alphaproteobacteria bacterium]
MSVSADMYIVISLMFAVFAAVAAVGTSLVLGVGFERLRAGFEIIKKQTGFFADAIHKLDERAEILDRQQAQMKESVASVTNRVERVEKQTGFFFDSLHSLEAQILKGYPMQAKSDTVEEVKTAAETEEKKISKPVLPQVMEWTSTAEASRLLQANEDVREQVVAQEEKTPSRGLTASIFDYLMSDNRTTPERGVVYH